MTAIEKLPETIDKFITASNSHDSTGFISFFAPDARVNDIQRNFLGTEAIKAWADKEIIGDRVTMKVKEVSRHYEDWIITAKIDGTYDKTNVPDPLYLDYYFTLKGNKIVKLIIIAYKAF